MSAPALVRRRPCDGSVEIRVRMDESGASSYDTLRSSGALAVRATIDGVCLVGASAHPIGGDNLRIEVEVDSGASLAVGSVSATLARASAPPEQSTMVITATVAQGARLQWSPEPGIAACGSDHVSKALVSLHPTSTLCWSDAIVLSRENEEFGSWSSHLRIEIGQRPLLDSQLALGPLYPAWRSTAVLGSARSVHSMVLVDPTRQAPESLTHAGNAFAVALSERAVQLMAWGASFTESRHALRCLADDPRLVRWRQGALEEGLFAN